MKIETVLKVLEDEKRLNKMFAHDGGKDEEPKVFSRPSFDAGISLDEQLMEFDSIMQSFVTLDGKDKFTLFAKDDAMLDCKWGWIRHYVKTSNDRWFRIREDDMYLPDEIAERMVKFGELMFSRGLYLARREENTFFYSTDDEEMDAMHGVRAKSPMDTDVDDWESDEYATEREDEGFRWHNRLREEAEYKDPRVYTNRWDDDYFGYARQSAAFC